MEKVLLHIETWLEAVKSRTIPLLAKKAGVAPTTIRRILQREVTPEESTIKKILSVTATPEEFIDFMIEGFPDTCSHLGTLKSTAKGALSDKAHMWYKKDQLAFEIFLAAINQAGYPYDLLVKRLGENGRKKITSLLANRDSGLRLENGRLYCQKIHFPTYERVLEMSPLISDFAIQDADNRVEAAYIYATSYTKEERKKIHDALKNVMAVIRDLNESREPNTAGKPTVIQFTMATLEGEEEK